MSEKHNTCYVYLVDICLDKLVCLVRYCNFHFSDVLV